MTNRTILARCVALVLLAGTSAAALAHDYPDYRRQSLYVPVRDGTRLAVNIYRPADEDGVETAKLPVIFAFTPYRARFTDQRGQVQETALGDGLALRSLLRAGYVVAVADVRGKGASFGSRRGFQDRTEANDGHDLVEWLADRPYTTGEVGMIGCSYLGGTVMHTASTAPPSLKAIFVGATEWDKYEFVRGGGITAQFNTRPDEPLTEDAASVPVDADRSGALLRAAVAQHAQNTPMGPLWYGMPYRDSVSPILNSPFWEEVAIWRYADVIRNSGVASYFWGNWKDEPTSQVIVAAQNIGGRLLVGPGSHCETPAGFDFTGEITRYFDHHLKGRANGIDGQPRVTYWQDGGDGLNRYTRSDTWPGALSGTRTVFLGQAADGSPELAGRPTTSGSRAFDVDFNVADDNYFAFWPPSLDAHGITYDTPALEQPLELLGYPVAHVAVQLDRPDANVFVYLEEVKADGTVAVLSFGRLMVSHRAVSQAPWDTLGLPWHSGRSTDVAPLPVGQTGTLQIAMQPLSRRLPVGSKLRFLVTGADPRQRNLRDLTVSPPPRITVLHGPGAGSRIDLPVNPPRD